MKKQKKILLIGGGTGGHILPLRNLIDELLKLQTVSIEMIVHKKELDQHIIEENFADIPVRYFKAGKIRRYLSWENIKDGFQIIVSCWKAKKILKEIQPDIIFFKGGFVGFPFLIASQYLMNWKGKIYAHESDISPGVMTRFVQKKADFIFESFNPKSPCPLFFESSKIKKRTLSSKKPHVFVFGGSQGSAFINTIIEENKKILSKKYNITLVTGLGKNISDAERDITQYEFLSVQKISEYIHQSDIVISRAGANSLFEIMSAQKPSIIIPLPTVARNHQMLNAQFFAQKGLCVILEQGKYTPKVFLEMIEKTLRDTSIQKKLHQSRIENGAAEIARCILSVKTL